MTRPTRLTVVQTHPVQYFAPWFRHIHERCPEIALTVIYATLPGAAQQGAGFGESFHWDTPLTEGYPSKILRAPRPNDDVRSSRFWGVDVPEVGRAIAESRPDAVLINGWHSVTLLRALAHCRRAKVPAIYRGDTHWGSRPGGVTGFLWERKAALLLRLFSGYLSVGKRAREYLTRLGADPSRIFDSPHAVDNEFFRSSVAPFQMPSGRDELRRLLGIRPDAFVVLFVGKLEPVKRPLDAVGAVSRLGPGATLLVVGAGELAQACKDEASKRNVDLVSAGFMNQKALGRAYGAADCLVLPSESETWGLAVNEAMATGLPAVVSDRVGCAPDLVTPAETGEVFPAGDETALAASLHAVRDRLNRGHDFAPACRARVAKYSFDVATRGLLEACRRVTSPRVVLCGGHMVIVSGLERMTFEVLRGLRERGAAVHCILNSWENHRILPFVDELGASWSTGFYWYPFQRHTRNPVRFLQMVWDVLRTSAGLIRDARRFRATHVLVPEHVSALRNAPALLWLRARGVPVVLRVPNHPDPGRFYAFLWRRVLPPLVTRFVANSRFAQERLLAAGAPRRKVETIVNAVSRRAVAPGTDADIVSLAASRRTVLSVGQIAPFKGTHLLVEASLRLLDGADDLQTIIVGRLPEWPPDFVHYVRALRERIAASGHEDRVQFVGERANILEIMRASYVLALPILQEETFGNVALEAKSVGLPVVAFSSGGLIELVEHKVTGYLCPESSLSGLEEGLRFFLENPAARNQASVASLAATGCDENPYTLSRFHERWGSLFDELRRGA